MTRMLVVFLVAGIAGSLVARWPRFNRLWHKILAGGVAGLAVWAVSLAV